MAAPIISSSDVALILNTVLEGEHQYDGGGTVGSPDITVGQAIRAIYDYCAAPAENLDTTNGVAVIHSADGLKNRIVAMLANGNRSITSRDNS